MGAEEPRLQKYLASCGIASRRSCEQLIRQGRVRVNGDKAHLGMRVTAGDVVEVDGVQVGPEAPVHYLLNKPLGTITTADDPQGRPTVVDLVPGEPRVYPVGRLDADTAGLLLLTNDGELAHRLMHPSFEVDKTYEVLVAGRLDAAAVRALAEGVELDGRPTAPARVRVLQQGSAQTLLEMVIHEGRNRQVRRMVEAVGGRVEGLVRVGYAHLTLAGLAPGRWRELDRRDVRRLHRLVGLGRGRTG